MGNLRKRIRIRITRVAKESHVTLTNNTMAVAHSNSHGTTTILRPDETLVSMESIIPGLSRPTPTSHSRLRCGSGWHGRHSRVMKPWWTITGSAPQSMPSMAWSVDITFKTSALISTSIIATSWVYRLLRISLVDHYIVPLFFVQSYSAIVGIINKLFVNAYLRMALGFSLK